MFTAHLRERRAPVLVREGWSWGAFLFGPLWLLVWGAWVPALLLAAVWIVACGFVPGALLGPVSLGLALLAGVLGRDAVRWSLGLRGYRLAHVLAASDREAALVRLYAARRDLLEMAS